MSSSDGDGLQRMIFLAHLDLDLFPTDVREEDTCTLTHNSIDVMLALLALSPSVKCPFLRSLSFREARGALATWPLFGRGSPPQSRKGRGENRERVRSVLFSKNKWTDGLFGNESCLVPWSIYAERLPETLYVYVPVQDQMHDKPHHF